MQRASIEHVKTIMLKQKIVEIGLFFFIKSFPYMKEHLKSHSSTKQIS